MDGCPNPSCIGAAEQSAGTPQWSPTQRTRKNNIVFVSLCLAINKCLVSWAKVSVLVERNDCSVFGCLRESSYLILSSHLFDFNGYVSSHPERHNDQLLVSRLLEFPTISAWHKTHFCPTSKCAKVNKVLFCTRMRHCVLCKGDVFENLQQCQKYTLHCTSVVPQASEENGNLLSVPKVSRLQCQKAWGERQTDNLIDCLKIGRNKSNVGATVSFASLSS